MVHDIGLQLAAAPQAVHGEASGEVRGRVPGPEAGISEYSTFQRPFSQASVAIGLLIRCRVWRLP